MIFRASFHREGFYTDRQIDRQTDRQTTRQTDISLELIIVSRHKNVIQVSQSQWYFQQTGFHLTHQTRLMLNQDDGAVFTNEEAHSSTQNERQYGGSTSMYLVTTRGMRDSMVVTTWENERQYGGSTSMYLVTTRGMRDSMVVTTWENERQYGGSTSMYLVTTRGMRDSMVAVPRCI